MMRTFTSGLHEVLHEYETEGKEKSALFAIQDEQKLCT